MHLSMNTTAGDGVSDQQKCESLCDIENDKILQQDIASSIEKPVEVETVAETESGKCDTCSVSDVEVPAGELVECRESGAPDAQDESGGSFARINETEPSVQGEPSVVTEVPAEHNGTLVHSFIANARARRACAAAAGKRIQRVLAWEGCNERSEMFQAVAASLEAEFNAEDQRVGRRRASKSSNAATSASIRDVDSTVLESTDTGAGVTDDVAPAPSDRASEITAECAEHEDDFVACSPESVLCSDEDEEAESEDGSYESSFVVSDGEGETTEEHSSDEEEILDNDFDEDSDSNAQFVVTIKRRRL